MNPQKQKRKTYFTDTAFHNSSTEAKCLFNKTTKAMHMGFILLFIFMALNSFVKTSSILVIFIICSGLIASVAFSIKAIRCAMQLKKMYLEYTK